MFIYYLVLRNLIDQVTFVYLPSVYCQIVVEQFLKVTFFVFKIIFYVQLKVLLHGLIKLLPCPGLSLSNHQLCSPFGQLL